MKRFLSLVLAFVFLMAMLCSTAAATETDLEHDFSDEFLPVKTAPGFMCNVDNDNEVSSADARIILRVAVALDTLENEMLLFADADFDGVVSSADARLALRTAVSLEEKQEVVFEITENKSADCENEGFIKAKCEENGKELSITVKKLNHKFDEADMCDKNAVCLVCKNSINVEPIHSFNEDTCNGIRMCVYCGAVERFTPSHKLNNYVCLRCGYSQKAEVHDKLVSYVIAHGQQEATVLYCYETDEYAEYSLCYDTATGELYICCSFAVEAEGYIYYYIGYLTIPVDFGGYSIELDYFWNENLLAYGIYAVNASGLMKEQTNSAVSLRDYDSIPELSGITAEYSVIAEGTASESLMWLIDYANRMNISGVTADILGCSQLG